VRKTFSSLRIRNFRLYFIAMNIAATGTWMMRIAQAWLVLKLTDGSGTPFGMMTRARALPVLLVTPRTHEAKNEWRLADQATAIR